MGRLDKKVAVVTGGASGIGAASAILFAREGAKVVIGDLADGTSVVESIRQAGGEAIFQQANVSKERDVEFMISETVKTFGRVDILFNNAGRTQTEFMHEMSEADYDDVMGVNLKGVFFACKHAVIQMKKQGGGVILTNASKAAIVAGGCRPVYSASKGGVLQLMQAMALDYGKDNIRVNSLLPGSIDTPLADTWIKGQSNPRDARRLLELAQPIERLGTPEECAYAALFLVSDEASYITGTYLLVDGGFCAR